MEIKRRTIAMRHAVIAVFAALGVLLGSAHADPMKPFGANDSSNYQFPDPVSPSKYMGGGRLMDANGIPLSPGEDYYVRWRVWNMYHGFGSPMGPFSRWTNGTITQLSQLCIRIGINCNWLMALPSDVSSIVSMSPLELSNLSARAEQMMRNSAGVDDRVLEVLRRESQEFSRRLAAMNEAQRREYLKQYGAKPK